MNKLLIFTLFAMFALANSYTVTPGTWYLMVNGTCTTPITTLLNYTGWTNTLWGTNNYASGETYLFNQNMDSDGVSFTGYANVYKNGNKFGTTPTKGYFVSPFHFVVNLIPQFWFNGDTQYYSFSSCQRPSSIADKESITIN